jgi:3-deoxy-manno-octulosonate cytidylyltransferase (CMP-KDO synthetase)
MLKFAGIIPARYASTRFPGKPLVMIHGKTMIQRVYNQASKVLDYVCVATDDTRIENEVTRFGGKVIMTSPNHQSGTDRCAEAIGTFSLQSGSRFDVVINIQGDEPFIQPAQIEKLIKCFDHPDTQIATLVKPVSSVEDIFNPNCVKVVFDKNHRALYFSRSPIPYIRGKENSVWNTDHQFFKHLGIYAYRTDVLEEITRLQQGALELAESLEQLRWLENGYRIMVEETGFETISIDTPDDLDKIKTIVFDD